MKDYNKIYQSSASKANINLEKASSSISNAKISNKKIDELNALASLQFTEVKKFKNFEEKYDSLMSNDKILKILDGKDINTARDVYKTGLLNLTNEVNMSFEDLEAFIAIDKIKKGNNLDLKNLIEIVGDKNE